ncbi:Clusterin-associated protein 1 like [Pseudolycoriella hygida]|uniref:Clusterin-associated protein 1 like n=1 Tax=Pseudolycoriella hygida TaxID=35572 RepID=A0A9Q0MU93_9DIPT|nr:Clusterin-associated protein 1 like [Pseudolycoriella hygida]
MTFKDVRDLSEHLKHLDYPNNFSILPLCSAYGSVGNFKIVAHILQWLAERFESDAILLGGTDNEVERILMIRSAVEFFVMKVGIKLNPRKLYACTAGAASELLKLTMLLLNAPTEVNDQENLLGSSNIDLGDKVDDLRRVRELATDLTNKGASVYDLLAKELINKETRNLQATRPLELSNVEKYLKNSIVSLSQKLNSSKSALESSKSEKNAVNAKLERKTADLERSKSRLDALQKIRPAFLEEFERLEVELKGLYEQYFIRVRCLDALRVQIASRVRVLQTPMPIAKPAENSMTFLPDGLIDSDEDGLENEDVERRIIDEKREIKDDLAGTNEPRANTRLRVRTAVGRSERRFVGSMLAGSDLDSSLGSGDESDSEINLVDELEDEDDGSVGNNVTGESTNKPIKSSLLSDEDF